MFRVAPQLSPTLSKQLPGTMTRRDSIRLLAAASVSAGFFPWPFRATESIRNYHVCLSPEAILEDPDFPAILQGAGVSCVWLAGFFYGYWPWPLASLQGARDRLERAGLQTRVINVPLGHPGDSLGAKDGTFPLAPPSQWRLGVAFDGQTYSGTSLHAPATEENLAALRSLRKSRFTQVFLDDDFRLARSPGQIGGCFCDEHRSAFLRRTGFPPTHWPELLGDVRARRLTRLLREWVEFTCDDLTGSFQAQQRTAAGRLGIMVMYLGTEKAGIRLRDYRGVPFRVGELMFDDASFGLLKGKTDELFSVLFHRRFVAPKLAYSETTAYPADQLSAVNLGAKLVISTLADVRHTMFMSGITPFPKTHWTTLAPLMKRQASFHRVLAGHKLRGPFKHYWGEASRFCGDDRPFSLFLAAGIPFEVTERPAQDGWTFLSDADASAASCGQLVSPGTRFLSRLPLSNTSAVEQCEESLDALFVYKRRLDSKTPFVQNAEPAVLGWYPSARAALLWNPTAARTTFSVRHGSRTREVTIEALDSALLEDLAVK
jgi:hypothetical protein